MTAASKSKLPIVILMALVINVLMFTAIEMMVGMRRVRLTDTSDFDISNFIRVAEQSRDVRSRRDPQAPQKPKQQMQQDIQPLTAATSSAGTTGFSIEMPEIDIDLGGGIQIARELTPLVRIPADYPMAALMKGIEGLVELRFTVTEAGTVENPEILRSVPPDIFDRAARRAVLKWKYQPQMVDGKPIAVISYARLIFQMEEEEK